MIKNDMWFWIVVALFGVAYVILLITIGYIGWHFIGKLW